MPAKEPEQDPLQGHPVFEKLKFINSGSFGYVILAKNKVSGEQVAIKFVEVNSDKDLKHSQREIMNHMQLLHPHVVQLKEVFAAGPYLAIVMEYVPNGDMFNHVVSRRGLPENEARWFFQQLVLGMDYCHRKGVCNRDIKLENTLLVLQKDKKPLLKMCDFGYAKHDQLDSIAHSKVGTPGYTAPEVIECKDGSGYDGKLADVWSAGVMLYTMLFARYPFERPEDKTLRPHERTNKVLMRILKVDYVIPERPALSDEAKDLIQKILVKNPKERLSLEQIQNHPWFQTNLPQGSLEYNTWALQVPNPGMQPADVIDAHIVQAFKARKKLKEEERSRMA
uniref:Protein kinase domain-containing protein n=1 Tax=Picochlorum oklahomense TaxID=249345 RepID=A0A7S1CUB7_9CHLO|eukprot:CAMPEP_0118797620 /NCGR_PEP_ID=MMETSP1161-20130426/140_1 /TAXON_ID=249345 /ORGANISM="Picochlorum oklahomensis, Strain CCMP2329" /LENGTH=336 /DNA_ID=CAMNT_0006724823 /DNA_START=50 /DNA_END=1060 /DNA_ORIENTATION=-